MSEAWLKQQEEVWGDGPEFRHLVDSIHARNDAGPLEGDSLAARLAGSGAKPVTVAKALVDWALKDMPTEGAYLRARERFNAGLERVAADLEGPGHPHGAPLATRSGRSLLWTVVNALLRGPPPASVGPRCGKTCNCAVDPQTGTPWSLGSAVSGSATEDRWKERNRPGTMDGSGYGEGEMGPLHGPVE